MGELTDRQREILAFIARRIGEGLPPTLAEIAQAFGFNQPRAAWKHLQALQNKGCIELLPGRVRGIRLLADASRGKPAGLPLIGRVAAGRSWPKRMSNAVSRSMPGCFRRARISCCGCKPIVVARIEDEVTVKRLRVKRQRLQLVAENPAYAPIEVDPRRTAFAIEGLYVGVIRVE